MVLNLTSDRKMETMMVAEATVEMVPVIMGAMMSESSWGCDKDMVMVIYFHLFVCVVCCYNCYKATEKKATED